MALPNIFGADIAGQINSALGPLTFEQTLIKLAYTTDPANSTNQLEVEDPHICRGFIDEFDDDTMKNSGVKVTDRKIIIFGASLPSGIEPVPGDKIIAEGTTFTIVPDGVNRDPAGATFECQSK